MFSERSSLQRRSAGSHRFVADFKVADLLDHDSALVRDRGGRNASPESVLRSRFGKRGIRLGRRRLASSRASSAVLTASSTSTDINLIEIADGARQAVDFLKITGGQCRTRTCDLLLVRQAL